MGVRLRRGDSGDVGYREALDRLFQRTAGAVRPGLDRTRALLARLGDPHERVPVFHVAGTNGKGSVVASLTAALRWRGYRVGTYTSPHLLDFRERIVVDGRGIDPRAVTEFLDRHDSLITELDATFFEVTTVMAFDWFARERVQVAVVEVGLGGLLDSTNVVHPVCAGVVSVGIDHTEYLGESLQAIAREKGGIFKRGVPAVIGPVSPEVEAVLVSTAREAHSAPIVDARHWMLDEGDIRLGERGTTFTAAGGTEVTTPLIGEHQAFNTAVALSMLDAAGAMYRVTADMATEALAAVRLPGRFHHHGHYLFDVAHNPAGARALAQTLEVAHVARPLAAVVAVLSDKDWRGMLAALAPHVDRLVLTSAPSAPAGRVWDVGAAAAWARTQGWVVEEAPDFDEALRRARSDSATMLVTGSFHTVGDAMLRLQVDPLDG